MKVRGSNEGRIKRKDEERKKGRKKKARQKQI